MIEKRSNEERKAGESARSVGVSHTYLRKSDEKKIDRRMKFVFDEKKTK
jgi:hypothetical protein